MWTQIGVTAVAVLLAMIAGYWALAKMVVAQFNAALDVRFAALETSRQEGRRAIEERFKRMEAKQDETERDVRRILVELPREYVRREDYVRGQSVIEGKIDGLALRVENIMLKGGRE